MPFDWEKSELFKYTEKPQYGFTDSAVENGEYKFLRITDIQDSQVIWSKVPYCKCNESEYFKYCLKEGDILFARIGATTGKSYYATNPPKSIFASYLIRVRAVDNKLDSKFLFYYFQSSFYWKQINQNKSNNLKGGVNGTILSGLSIIKPPLPEQRKIAAILSTVQKAIENQQALIDRTTELKKAMMHKLFTEGTKGEKQKMTEIGLVPESWEVVPCDSLCSLITVGVVVGPASYYVQKGVPAFRSFNVREDFLNISDIVYFAKDICDTIHKKSQLHTGDVLVVRTGYPGTSCVVPEEYDGANCIDIVIVRPNNNLIDSYFLSRFFNSSAGKNQSVSAKHGLAQQHLNVAAIKRPEFLFQILKNKKRYQKSYYR